MSVNEIQSMVRELPLIHLPPNRVRRNYLGGATLDAMQGIAKPIDGNRPEDWIGSTIGATNPGLPPIEDEGLSHGEAAALQKTLLTRLFAESPAFYLGQGHVDRLGTQLGFLAKLLDSSIRLHVQAHPTAAFAQQHLGSRWGKLETYVILAVRPGVSAPYIRLGFQRAPSRAEWQRIVFEQDIAAMDACFDPIPVHVGETWLVPGGLPHAIGEGVLMLEVMEPTDLVVRCEFEREGIIVPPAARFMQRDPEFAMRIFDYEPLPLEELHRRYRIAPTVKWQRPGDLTETLIDRRHTDCFSIERMTIKEQGRLASNGVATVCVVAAGNGRVKGGEQSIELSTGSKFLIAAGAREVVVRANSGQPLQLLIVRPGAG